MAGSTRLTAAVVGAGIAGGMSIAALLASPRYQLVGVADPSADARERIGKTIAEKVGTAVPVFASADELLAAHPVDVVCISTFAGSHLPLTRTALAAEGLRGLLVEKPLGETAAVGAEILERVKAAGLPLVVPHGLMGMSASIGLIDDVHAGRIGRLRVVEIACTGWDLFDAGVHWIQFFLTLVQSPVETVLMATDSSTRTYRNGIQSETESVTLARTSTGVRLLLNTGDDIPIDGERKFGCHMRIIGDRGLIEYSAWSGEYTVVTPSEDRVVVRPDPLPESGHSWHLARLGDQIESGERDYGIPERSVAALEVVEGAYRSARIRGSVRFPLAGVQPPSGGDWDPGATYAGVGGGRDGKAL